MIAEINAKLRMGQFRSLLPGIFPIRDNEYRKILEEIRSSESEKFLGNLEARFCGLLKRGEERGEYNEAQVFIRTAKPEDFITSSQVIVAFQKREYALQPGNYPVFSWLAEISHLSIDRLRWPFHFTLSNVQQARDYQIPEGIPCVIIDAGNLKTLELGSFNCPEILLVSLDHDKEFKLRLRETSLFAQAPGDLWLELQIEEGDEEFSPGPAYRFGKNWLEEHGFLVPETLKIAITYGNRVLGFREIQQWAEEKAPCPA